MSQNKHVLFVTPYLDVGGTEKVILQLCGLLSNSIQTTVLSSGGALVDQFKKKKAEIVSDKNMQARSLFGILFAAVIVHKIVRQKQYHVINPHSFISLCSVWIGTRFVYAKPKILFSLHIPEKDHYYIVIRLFLLITRIPTVVVSEAIKQELIKGFGKKLDVITVYNGVDVNSFSHVKKASPDTEVKKLICVSRLVLRKNHHVILRALRIINQEYPAIKVKLYFYGDGEFQSELEKFVKSLNLVDQVVFCGTKKDVRDCFDEANVKILASKKEGLPLSVIEAMASGVPVICSRIDGNKELITHQQNGLLFEPDDEVALASAILKLLVDPVYANDLTKKALQTVKSKFDEVIFFDAYTRLLVD